MVAGAAGVRGRPLHCGLCRVHCGLCSLRSLLNFQARCLPQPTGEPRIAQWTVQGASHPHAVRAPELWMTTALAIQRVTGTRRAPRRRLWTAQESPSGRSRPPRASSAGDRGAPGGSLSDAARRDADRQSERGNLRVPPDGLCSRARRPYMGWLDDLRKWLNSGETPDARRGPRPRRRPSRSARARSGWVETWPGSSGRPTSGRARSCATVPPGSRRGPRWSTRVGSATTSAPWRCRAGVPAHEDPGYSFSGSTCMFTWGDQCSDGKALAMIVSLSGKIATGPGTIEYTYTSELFCGGVLSCVENGKSAGTRSGGAAQSAEGKWYGSQTWTVQCCAARYALTRGRSAIRVTGVRPPSGSDEGRAAAATREGPQSRPSGRRPCLIARVCSGENGALNSEGTSCRVRKSSEMKCILWAGWPSPWRRSPPACRGPDRPRRAAPPGRAG